jgi:hypothetical protein
MRINFFPQIIIFGIYHQLLGTFANLVFATSRESMLLLSSSSSIIAAIAAVVVAAVGPPVVCFLR